MNVVFYIGPEIAEGLQALGNFMRALGIMAGVPMAPEAIEEHAERLRLRGEGWPV